MQKICSQKCNLSFKTKISVIFSSQKIPNSRLIAITLQQLTNQKIRLRCSADHCKNTFIAYFPATKQQLQKIKQKEQRNQEISSKVQFHVSVYTAGCSSSSGRIASKDCHHVAPSPHPPSHGNSSSLSNLLLFQLWWQLLSRSCCLRCCWSRPWDGLCPSA